MSRAPAALAALVLGLAMAPGMAPGGTVTAGKQPVPAVLKATESSAEDIVDYALAGNRGQVTTAAAELRAAATGPAAAALAGSGASPADISTLRQRATRVAALSRHGSFVQIALAANAVSQLMAGFYARFRDPVPPGILTLDYLDREAQLRSLAGQRPEVAAAIRQLVAFWPRTRPLVVAAGGATQAAAYQAHVAAMKRLAPGAGARIRAEAVRGLALVDKLEQVFTG